MDHVGSMSVERETSAESDLSPRVDYTGSSTLPNCWRSDSRVGALCGVKRCAIYARYSSDLQSPTSISDQLRVCESFAERQGWTVVARFEDAALSGFGVEHRPGYRALVAAAIQSPPPFDLILVEDVSRLTRDLSEVLRLYHRLRLKGVDLVGISDGVSTVNQSGKVTLTVKGLVNELYLDDLRAKTHRGLEGRIARGMSAGGRLFGYRTVSVPGPGDADKRDASARFEVDEREAEIVRRIFREYAAGRSLKTIAHQLNVEGVPFPAKDTKRGPAGLCRRSTRSCSTRSTSVGGSGTRRAS
jgi:DNA invertase Pin-like site-specific DNA recombinase